MPAHPTGGQIFLRIPVTPGQNHPAMKKVLTVLALFVAVTTLCAQSDDGPPYHIFSIYFGGGSWYIDAEQTQELYEWIDGIEGIENHEISIHGHTDDIGSVEYNQWLSRNRCQAAFQKLIEKGIPGEQISIADFGEKNPVYDNSTWEGKLRNRRVDIIIRPLIL